MKILMLGWELPPHNSGGLGVICYQLCKVLSKKGASIEFILPYTAEHPGIDFMHISAAHPQDVEAVMKSGMAYDSFKYIKADGQAQDIDLFGQCAIYEEAVGRIVQDSEYDIIHAHDWLTCRAALKAKMLTGLPLVVHFHSIEADRAGKPFGGNPFVRDIEQTALLIADQIIAVSEHTKEAIMREYDIPGDKIAVVHNHIDQADLIPEPKPGNSYAYLDYLRSRGWHVVSNIGRMTIQKGLPNLLRAFKLVVEREPKTMLLLAGAGEQYHELVRMSADLGLSRNVMFAGFQRGREYRDSFTVADLFVMPSVSEPFGLTALESVGYGTPLLISRQSGVSEVINNCLKVDFWDIEEMANKMVNALRSEALRTEISRNATQEYLRLSWNKSVDTLLDIYANHARGARTS
jgi:glycogen synthase